MSAHVPLTRLIERTNDEGQRVLSGWLGGEKLIGFRGDLTANGNETWLIFTVEPDERAIEAKRRGYRERKPVDRPDMSGECNGSDGPDA